MGLLKAFVIASGVVLVVGTIVLAALVIARAVGGGPASTDDALRPRVVDLELPAAAEIEQVVPDGDRVLLLGRGPAGGQFLAVVDPETGERLRLIRFRTAP